MVSLSVVPRARPPFRCALLPTGFGRSRIFSSTYPLAGSVRFALLLATLLPGRSFLTVYGCSSLDCVFFATSLASPSGPILGPSLEFSSDAPQIVAALPCSSDLDAVFGFFVGVLVTARRLFICPPLVCPPPFPLSSYCCVYSLARRVSVTIFFSLKPPSLVVQTPVVSPDRGSSSLIVLIKHSINPPSGGCFRNAQL